MSEQTVWVLEPSTLRRRMFFQRVDSPNMIKLLYLNLDTNNPLSKGVTLAWMDKFLGGGETMVEGEPILVSIENARKVWQYLIDYGWKCVLNTQKEAMS